MPLTGEAKKLWNKQHYQKIKEQVKKEKKEHYKEDKEEILHKKKVRYHLKKLEKKEEEARQEGRTPTVVRVKLSNVE